MTNQEIGNIGENAAANLLIEKGYTILNRNYHAGHLEVDTIALKDDVVAFESVNYRKQNYIANAANSYMQRFKRTEEARLDVIIVLHKNGTVVEVDHIENAYYPRIRTY